ncbi:hypothetical protein J5N97_011626 [Dioscorea zingiberensis]|uniref:Uncharacterized protein n=1 Tax=Dioscorea zingiberensis TaxID=325984 RepID=A0A9D5HNX6_9LILI|nr:hypothetical protein J5N97_011626 [Dioscorea zingiberensis]
MRLLRLVPCGGWRDTTPEDLPEDPPMAPMKAATRVSVGKRRRAASHSSTPWRPSLGPISEDGVAAAAAADKVGERTGTSRMRSTSRVPSHRERDDYRNYGVPQIAPAFTPTAFLF